MKINKIGLFLLLSAIIILSVSMANASSVNDTDNSIIQSANDVDYDDTVSSDVKEIEKKDKNLKTAQKLNTYVNIDSKTTYDTSNITIPVSVKDSNNKYVNNGRVYLYLDNKLLGSNTLTNGRKDMKIFKINPGTYTLKATYNSSTYKSSTKTAKLTILTKDTILTLNSITTYNTTYIKVPVAVKDKNNNYVTNGKVTLYLDNKLLGTNTLTNGRKDMTIFKLNPGTYNMKAEYNSNTYKTSMKTAKLTVLTKDTTLTLNPITTFNTSNIIIPVAVKDANNNYVTNGKVTLYIDNKLLGTNTLTNGRKNMTIFKLNPGKYSLKAVYNSSTYKTSTKTTTLTINSLKTNVILNPINTTNHTNIRIPVTVKDSTNKNVNNGRAYLYLNNKLLGHNTLSNGQCNMMIGKLNDGNYNITVKYQSDTYTNSSKTVNLKVYTIPTLKNTKITLKTNTNIYYSNSSTIKASILTSDNKNVGTKGDVYIYENNKLIGKSKVTNGNATITVTKPSVGQHTYTAIYNSTNYKSSTNTIKVNVQSYSSYAKTKKPYIENPNYYGEQAIVSTIELGGDYYHLGCGGKLYPNGKTQSYINSRNMVESLKCKTCGHVFSDHKYDYTDFL
jgi:hypothetical protein